MSRPIQHPKLSSSTYAHGALVNFCDNFDRIRTSGQFRSNTGGRTYATTIQEWPRAWTSRERCHTDFGALLHPLDPNRHLLNPLKDPGVIVFEGRAAALFRPHPFEGLFSGYKWALNQFVTKDGILQWESRNARLCCVNADGSPWKFLIHPYRTRHKVLIVSDARVVGSGDPRGVFRSELERLLRRLFVDWHALLPFTLYVLWHYMFYGGGTFVEFAMSGKIAPWLSAVGGVGMGVWCTTILIGIYGIVNKRLPLKG
ncbi:hypothetical protein JHL17_16840 [Azospirillum sp. YIM B02556]|uniref:Uncharacterized protein n=1 Tax=Azospirillum endophyticum TaxID=2800326 RepID=A0ABS1F6P7_9PROT|nr:hypothetical protein [Azospirillum endophyticum]MBK1839080.1 hypothetical protein [Azospirillum endophyticum]